MNTPLHRVAMFGTLTLLAALIALAACDTPPAPGADGSAPASQPGSQPGGHDMHGAGGSAPAPTATLEGPGKGKVFNFTLTHDPPAPPMGSMFKLEAKITDASGNPLTNAKVKLDATMPEHGHGMTTQPQIKELGDGRYVAEGMKLHMPGRWVFTADADADARGADNVSFDYQQSPRASKP